MNIHDNNVPIGILTRNRPAYLDLTLRSLLACKLPHNVQIIIYDDDSDLEIARNYLYTSNIISNVPLQISKKIFHYIPNLMTTVDLYGIKEHFKIVSMEAHLGVLHASLNALCDLLDKTNSEYVCLIQDDIVLIKNWYNIMINLSSHYKPGILSGISFGCAASPCENNNKYIAVKVKWTQAQCLFISRNLLKLVLPELQKLDSSKKCHFDLLLCEITLKYGFDVLVTQPHICQHVGKYSLVEPKKKFNHKGGRYSNSIYEPFVVKNKL